MKKAETEGASPCLEATKCRQMAHTLIQDKFYEFRATALSTDGRTKGKPGSPGRPIRLIIPPPTPPAAGPKQDPPPAKTTAAAQPSLGEKRRREEDQQAKRRAKLSEKVAAVFVQSGGWVARWGCCVRESPYTVSIDSAHANTLLPPALPPPLRVLH